MFEKIITIPCLQCGGKIEISQKTGIPTCRYCRREYRSSLSDFSYELQEISSRRQMREFAQAEELCHELLRKQPDCAECYWQLLLASHGIVYVHDENEAKPTFFCYSYKKHDLIKNNDNYNMAIKLADSEQRTYFSENAILLDSLMQSFFELIDKQSSYDIFISFKKSEIATVGNSKRAIDTEDYAKACEIYQHLKDKYRVFFSPVSLGADPGIVGEKYEPKILKALQTAQAMILVGSKQEYLEATWVENEWKRYQYFIDKGHKKKNSLILGYTRAMPQLPTALRDIQLPTVDMFPSGYLKDIEQKLSFVKSSRGLKSLLSSRVIESDFVEEDSKAFGYGEIEHIRITGSGNKTTVSISPTQQRDLQTASTLLNEGQFKNAERMFTNVISRNSDCAGAYFGRFLARIHSKSVRDGIVNAKRAYWADIENALAVADEKYALYVIDTLIDTLHDTYDSHIKEIMLDVISKYLDDNQIAIVLMHLYKSFERLLAANKVSECERMCEYARKLFTKTNRIKNINFLFNYASRLLDYGYYSAAKKYFEELAEAGIKENAHLIYWRLLSCRLKSKTPERVKFIPKCANKSKIDNITDIELGDVLARIILSDTNRELDTRICEMIEWQILRNYSHSREFVELVVSCYKQIDAVSSSEALLDIAAYTCLRSAKYSTAKIYYKEMLVFNASNSQAHFGLLKCKLKALYDKDVAKKSKNLMKYDEFNNALNCATDREYQYYMELAAGRAEHWGTLGGPYSNAEIIEQIKISLLHLSPFIIAYIMLAGLVSSLIIAITLLAFSVIGIIFNLCVLEKRANAITKRSQRFWWFAHYRLIFATAISLLNLALAIISIVCIYQ